ncbi:hypothetical protein PO124_21340 [Bacillus licheniformis]|nr:hypothetical protein [Bacillus licheniformis]
MDLKDFSGLNWHRKKRNRDIQAETDRPCLWDVTRETFAVERGPYRISVGSSAADIRKTKRIFVQGETIRERNLRRKTNAEDYDDYKGVLITEESKYGGDAVKAVQQTRGSPTMMSASKAKKDRSKGCKQRRRRNRHLPRPSSKGKQIGSLKVPDTSGLQTGNGKASVRNRQAPTASFCLQRESCNRFVSI